MELQFNTNPKINLVNANDSMELDSKQTIAWLTIKDEKRKTNVKITIEVKGEVTVLYKGQFYYNASEMPEELLALFHTGEYDPDPENLDVRENNWFEIFIEDNGVSVETEVVDVGGYTDENLLKLMVDTYTDYIKDTERQK